MSQGQQEHPKVMSFGQACREVGDGQELTTSNAGLENMQVN